MNLKSFALLMCVLVFAYACKKPDTEAPFIQILKPASMSEYSIHDYVPLSAKVTDNRKIEYVKVDLVHDDYTPAKNLLNFNPESNEFTFDEGYYLDDVHLESGNYYIRVSASDGHSTGVSYRAIKINGIPRVLKRVYVLDYVSGNVNVSVLNGSGTAYQYSVSTDYQDAVFSNYYQYMAISGKSTGSLYFLDTNGVVLWTDPIQQNPPFNYFNHITYDTERNLTYVSYSTQVVRGYSPTNAVIFGMNLPQQAQAVGTWSVNSSHFIMQLRDYTQPRQLALVNYISATIQQVVNLNFDILNAFEKSSTEYLIFGNENNQGILRTYFPATNIMSIVGSVPAGKINAVVQISATEYILAMTTGMYRYTTSSGVMTPIVSGIDFTDVVYNDMSDLLFCATGDQIHLYSRFGAAAGTYTHTAPIVKVLLNFSK